MVFKYPSKISSFEYCVSNLKAYQASFIFLSQVFSKVKNKFSGVKDATGTVEHFDSDVTEIVDNAYYGYEAFPDVSY